MSSIQPWRHQTGEWVYPDDDGTWRVCEGCGIAKPDARPAPRWSDEVWCDACNGNRERE